MQLGEPITTVLLTIVLLHERVPALVILSLLPIVVGVGISSMSDTSFNLLGFSMVLPKIFHATPAHTNTPCSLILSSFVLTHANYSVLTLSKQSLLIRS